jgi:hypothetical protein
MKRILFISLFLTIANLSLLYSQTNTGASVYLVTCGPGTETYSVYGHTALRIVIPEKKSDLIYNWGVFEFDAPNFTWKFAKGRLDYWLDVEPFQQFLQSYIYEKRYVISQKINLEPDEVAKLLGLIAENLKPENIKYRYDFFYDDCSTRIRDLLEKTIAKKLLYPPAEKGNVPTFRQLVGKYQEPYPWLNFGIDLIMGSPGDKKASFRDRMFLPIELQSGLSKSVINRDGKMIPLLQDPEAILDFDPPVVRRNFLITPAFTFTLLVIVLIILSALIKQKKLINAADILVFSIFSALAVLMIFFNFFTDHEQMRLNLNIIWLSPFIFPCLIVLLLGRMGIIWFRILFYVSAVFLGLHMFLPQQFNFAFLPLVLILLVRSSVRADFDWNPLSVK